MLCGNLVGNISYCTIVHTRRNDGAVRLPRAEFLI